MKKIYIATIAILLAVGSTSALSQSEENITEGGIAKCGISGCEKE
ncbi:hypothetical protein AAG587_08225 [Vreelandella neptunia]